MNEQDIFVEAMDRTDPAERSGYLDEACQGDSALRERVDNLIRQSDQLGSFLEHPPLAAAAEGSDPTILCSKGSTCGDEDEARLKEDMNENAREEGDEIPLGYLQPSSDPNSLGRLGHYEILEVIGRGAFGIVLRAFDEKLQRVVAIKVLAPEMAATSPARKRFLREARASAQIRHENVVAIYAVEDDPIPHLVMEYIPGKTLQRRLDEDGPLALPDVLRLGKQIADGLAAAHAEGLIHRDIKPGNVLLEGGMNERVKITDFGLARTADDASMTQSGMIAGTPMYMAPEQAHGHKLDQRADLFSFGSVLYQMMSGRPPFRARTTMAVLKRVTEDQPRPIQEIIPEAPTWMCELIGHLHAKDPDDRYSSAREVSELLTQCAFDLQAGRIPIIPNPSKTKDGNVEQSPLVASKPLRPRRNASLLHRPLVKVAAAVVIMLGLLGISEATGITNFASTAIRLTTGSGILVIETDDPGVSIVIDGEEITIRGGGVEELTLRPGAHQIAAMKDGKAVMQEISITRNGRTVVRMSLEADGAKTSNSRQPSSSESAATDWVKLFNGQDLTGWRTHPETPGHWEVKDGVLTGSTKTSYLFTQRGDFANFHLRMEVKVSGSGDGGVFFRAPFAMRHGPQAWMVQPASGYELELYNQPEPVGSIWQIIPAARPNLLCRASGEVQVQPDVWFTVELIAQENRFVTKVNGKQSVEGNDLLSRYSAGHLALYAIGEQTVVQFRNVEIRELPPFQPAAPALVHRKFSSDEWIDVIPLIEPEMDKWNISSTGKNEWRIENGELLVGAADDKPHKLLLPIESSFAPSFECELELTRRAGESGFIINIPQDVGDFPLAFDAPGTPGGVTIGKWGQSETLTETAQIETGKRTTLRIEVRRQNEADHLSVWRDGEQVAAWSGNRNQLPGYANEGYPHHRRLSLFTFPGGSELVFHRIRVRMLDGGTAETVRPVAEKQAFQWPADAPPPAIAPFDAEQAKAYQEAWAKHLGVPVEKELVLGQDKDGEDVALTMVLIPPGEFLMGSTDEEQGRFLQEAKDENDDWAINRIPGEGPQHRVRITKPFWLGRDEVTIAQFRRFAEAAEYKTDAEQDGLGGYGVVDGNWVRAPQYVWSGEIGFPQTDQHPAVNISWNDSAALCHWLSQEHSGWNFTLPTEAQREYACRAGTTTYWHFGDNADTLPEYAWFHANSGDRTHPVGELKPNPFGLYDMHGNAWEWCTDRYRANYSYYANSPEDDPAGPAAGTKRIHRGGGWNAIAGVCRSANRAEVDASWRTCVFGFRVAATLADGVPPAATISNDAAAPITPITNSDAP